MQRGYEWEANRGVERSVRCTWLIRVLIHKMSQVAKNDTDASLICYRVFFSRFRQLVNPLDLLVKFTSKNLLVKY